MEQLDALAPAVEAGLIEPGWVAKERAKIEGDPAETLFLAGVLHALEDISPLVGVALPKQSDDAWPLSVVEAVKAKVGSLVVHSPPAFGKSESAAERWPIMGETPHNTHGRDAHATIESLLPAEAKLALYGCFAKHVLHMRSVKMPSSVQDPAGTLWTAIHHHDRIELEGLHKQVAREGARQDITKLDQKIGNVVRNITHLEKAMKELRTSITGLERNNDDLSAQMLKRDQANLATYEAKKADITKQLAPLLRAKKPLKAVLEGRFKDIYVARVLNECELLPLEIVSGLPLAVSGAE